MFQSLESRRLLSAGSVWVNDNWSIVTDLNQPGLSEGDIVSNTGAGDDGAVVNKTFGVDAFSDISSAVAAEAALGGGGVVNVISGVYAESDIVLNTPITIAGNPANRDAVQVVPAIASNRSGSLYATGVHSGFILRSSNVTIRDLTIDGDGGSGSVGGAGMRNYRGGIVYDYRPGVAYNNLSILNNVIKNTYDLGVYIDGGYNVRSVGQIVAGNSIHHVGGGTRGSAIHLLQTSATVTGNVLSSSTVAIASNTIDGVACAPVLVVRGNNISGIATGMHLASLADGSDIGGPLASDGNSIVLNGANGVGILVDYAVGQAVIENNAISGSGTDSGIWLYSNTNPAKPVVVRNNILSSSASVASNPGQGTGVFLTDWAALFFSTTPAPCYATIVGNTISNFAKAIDLEQIYTLTPAGATLSVVIGGAGLGEGNTLSGSGAAGTVGINIVDLNGTNPANAIAGIVNNNSVYSGFSTAISLAGGTATMSGYCANGSVMSVLVDKAGLMNLNGAQSLTSLTINNGGTVGVATGVNQALRCGALAISGESVLNLTGSNLVLDYGGATPTQQVRAWLFNGRLGAGARIRTTQAGGALGLMDNAMVHLNQFAGQTLTGFGQVLVKSTVAGDVNLDGQVNKEDLLALFSNLNHTGIWIEGDVNYDGVVGLEDLGEVQANWGKMGTSASLGAMASTGRGAPGQKMNNISKKPVKKTAKKGAGHFGGKRS